MVVLTVSQLFVQVIYKRRRPGTSTYGSDAQGQWGPRPLEKPFIGRDNAPKCRLFDGWIETFKGVLKNFHSTMEISVTLGLGIRVLPSRWSRVTVGLTRLKVKKSTF